MTRTELTDLLSKAKAAREFWIDSIPNDEDLSDDESYVYDAFEKKPIQGPPQWIHNLVHVREVTASDEAITRLAESYLEALELIKEIEMAPRIMNDERGWANRATNEFLSKLQGVE